MCLPRMHCAAFLPISNLEREMMVSTLALLMIYSALMLAGAIAVGAWKGRVFAALVWAAFLGPFGWVVIALGPNLKPITSAPCPHCGGVIPINQGECAHCKNKVRWLKGKVYKASRAVA